MRIKLTVIAGPHQGTEFTFAHHDTFLVGRSRHAHFQLPAKDKYFSRVHFMLEVNPPHCRLIDMGSHNGTYLNGQRVLSAELHDGDQIRAGHTVLSMHVLPAEPGAAPETVEFFPEAFAPNPAAVGGELPFFPGYMLSREIGVGTLGKVYQGQRLSDGALVAVKQIRTKSPASPGELNDFLRPARFLLKLSHAHLARLCDVGASYERVYFVSEFVKGRSAEDVLRADGPLPVRRAVRWASGVLQALRYAHGLHFVHGDIKPTNVMVEETDGQDLVKLTDFGVARAYHAAPFSGLGITDALLSGATFLPPELLLDYRNVQPSADQFAVGATLYYLLTGAYILEVPQTVRRRVSTLLRQQIVPIRDRRPDLPAALADVIHRALARSPAQRYADVAQFRQALVKAVQDG